MGIKVNKNLVIAALIAIAALSAVKIMASEQAFESEVAVFLKGNQ
ncbi:MAG: hypothetical protein ACI8WB_000086 [Phenylobacterium sp.]|jgi:hypothetical protein